MWKGSVSFGLVNVPVRMFAATESKDIKFRYLHKDCQSPLEYKRTCPTCQREVQWNEIVRGFEYETNRFVVMNEEDLESLNQPRGHSIDILDFVLLSEIDPVYYDKTYYLSPESSGSKAYHLLQRAMEETNKIAIAKTVLRNSETLACLRVYNHVLVMETLFWPDEVRPTAELPNLTTAPEVSESELEMAMTLVNQLAKPFEAARYKDERRSQLQDVIQNKVANQEVSAPVAAAPRENIVDLMQALQESIRQAKPGTATKAGKMTKTAKTENVATPAKATTSNAATAATATNVARPATSRATTRRSSRQRSS